MPARIFLLGLFLLHGRMSAKRGDDGLELGLRDHYETPSRVAARPSPGSTATPAADRWKASLPGRARTHELGVMPRENNRQPAAHDAVAVARMPSVTTAARPCSWPSSPSCRPTPQWPQSRRRRPMITSPG